MIFENAMCQDLYGQTAIWVTGSIFLNREPNSRAEMSARLFYGIIGTPFT